MTCNTFQEHGFYTLFQVCCVLPDKLPSYNRQQRLLEAAHRYRYALKRLATIEQAGDLRETFVQLETNLLLNLSRAERRRGNNLTALQLSSRVLQSQPQSVQVSPVYLSSVLISPSSLGFMYQS